MRPGAGSSDDSGECWGSWQPLASGSCKEEALVSVVMDVDQWGGTSSTGLWQSDDGVTMFTNRQLGFQVDMLGF